MTNLRWRQALGAVILAAVLPAAWILAQLTDARPIPSLLPPGALLYLEAKDFHRVLTEWNASAEKRRWLGSSNYQQLSTSRLIQRLMQANGEFETAAGVPIGMGFTDQVAGTRSGFAFYDLGQLAFVYLTQMPQTRIEGTELWRQRAVYQTRESVGAPFYVKGDAKSGRKVAFASYKGWFVVASDEDRMAQTLALLAGQKAPSLAAQEWFTTAVRQRPEAGDLRLVYDMTALLKSPQYRTYWLQRNGSEMQGFASGVADLFEREDGFVEERVMVRKSEVPVSSAGASISDVAAFAPAGGSSLVRGWQSPDAQQIEQVVQQVVVGDAAGARTNGYQSAPPVNPEAGAVGNESDLEIRIDQPPFERASERPVTPLVNALIAMQPLAMTHVQLTTVLRDQVFVLPQSGVVLLCQKADRGALEESLAQATTPLQMGSIDPLSVSVEGQIVMLSRVPLSRGGTPLNLDRSATYMAAYEHRTEWPHYKKLFGVLDQSSAGTQPGLAANTPTFFSMNLGSLGDSLSRLERATLVSFPTAGTVHETVHYQLAKP